MADILQQVEIFVQNSMSCSASGHSMVFHFCRASAMKVEGCEFDTRSHHTFSNFPFVEKITKVNVIKFYQIYHFCTGCTLNKIDRKRWKKPR